MGTAIVKPAPRDEEAMARLAAEMKSPLFVADLLFQRDIRDKEAARAFFLATPPAPDPSRDTENLLDLDLAVTLLEGARERGEKVVVHGDYDVDGVTGTALLYLGLKWCGFDVGWFLPNRFEEGYGLSQAGVRRLHARGFRWIISVDTGIAAVDEIKLARELGMHVIVTDHHQAAPERPEADAIVNPNQGGCPYPNKGLAGVGVAFKVLDSLAMRFHGRPATPFLDLVALGSLADNVPIIGENRTLVKAGLRQLATSPRVGISALLKQAGLSGTNAGSTDLMFKAIPLLNAAGRMGSADVAVRLLIEEDSSQAAKWASALADENGKRRKLDQSITKEAFRKVESSPALSEASCLVLASRNWHEGVIGIVAARLVEKFCRPAFVLAIDAKGTAKGSGRTVPGFNLHKALATVAPLLEKWGGHYYACGFTILEANIAVFTEKMAELGLTYLSEGPTVRQFHPAATLRLSELDEDGMLWLKRFEPFGPRNELPLFYSEDVKIASSPIRVGDEHLKMTLGTAPHTFEAIGFGMGHMLPDLKGRDRLSGIAYYPEWNHFRGTKRLQLRLAAIE